jgi:hypothetical protein
MIPNLPTFEENDVCIRSAQHLVLDALLETRQRGSQAKLRQWVSGILHTARQLGSLEPD